MGWSGINLENWRYVVKLVLGKVTYDDLSRKTPHFRGQIVAAAASLSKSVPPPQIAVTLCQVWHVCLLETRIQLTKLGDSLCRSKWRYFRCVEINWHCFDPFVVVGRIIIAKHLTKTRTKKTAWGELRDETKLSSLTRLANHIYICCFCLFQIFRQSHCDFQVRNVYKRQFR